jgi:hypothetical protein
MASSSTSTCADHLLDFVWAWLAHSDCLGLIRTAGDYETYMHVLTGIIEAYHEDPSIIDYVGDPDDSANNPPFKRKLAAVMDPACPSVQCISPGFYKQFVFEWQVNEGVHM